MRTACHVAERAGRRASRCLPSPPLTSPPLTSRTRGRYEYWYVLTYLPDLQWCHVAPLEKRGVFGGDGPSAGRPRWMLVAEEEGGEIDVGAGRCHVMQAREMKHTKESADEEEWDIQYDLEP